LRSSKNSLIDIHRVADGETLLVREVSARLKHPTPIALRFSALTGRTYIRWDASNIWLIPANRPAIDPEDARLELARRFLHWLGPATKAGMARWTGVKPGDASKTWRGIEGELAPVEVEGDARFMLAADLDALTAAKPIRGVRLLPMDDPLTKTDKDAARARSRSARPGSAGLGPVARLTCPAPYSSMAKSSAFGSVSSGRVRVRPFAKLARRSRGAIEAEALSMPIAGKSGTVDRVGDIISADGREVVEAPG
jgi:hypothetical protein